MNSESTPVTNEAEHSITISRDFDAPRKTVWTAWTDPAHVAKWWGPKGFTTKVHKLDPQPGGHWRYVMIGPDGTEYPIKGVFREVEPGTRIVATDEFDEGFEKVHSADLPQGIITTTTFTDLGNQTRLTLTIAHPSAEDRRKHEEMGVVAGWHSTLDCLEEHLRTM